MDYRNKLRAAATLDGAMARTVAKGAAMDACFVQNATRADFAEAVAEAKVAHLIPAECWDWDWREMPVVEYAAAELVCGLCTWECAA